MCSYSLEGLEVQREAVQTRCPSLRDQEDRAACSSLRLDSQERGSLISLTEEEQEGDGISIDSQVCVHVPMFSVFAASNGRQVVFEQKPTIISNQSEK